MRERDRNQYWWMKRKEEESIHTNSTLDTDISICIEAHTEGVITVDATWRSVLV